jgi:hypothetical protein
VLLPLAMFMPAVIQLCLQEETCPRSSSVPLLPSGSVSRGPPLNPHPLGCPLVHLAGSPDLPWVLTHWFAASLIYSCLQSICPGSSSTGFLLMNLRCFQRTCPASSLFGLPPCSFSYSPRGPALDPDLLGCSSIIKSSLFHNCVVSAALIVLESVCLLLSSE